jgi:hypothetical protein
MSEIGLFRDVVIRRLEEQAEINRQNTAAEARRNDSLAERILYKQRITELGKVIAHAATSLDVAADTEITKDLKSTTWWGKSKTAKRILAKGWCIENQRHVEGDSGDLSRSPAPAVYKSYYSGTILTPSKKLYIFRQAPNYDIVDVSNVSRLADFDTTHGIPEEGTRGDAVIEWFKRIESSMADFVIEHGLEIADSSRGDRYSAE